MPAQLHKAVTGNAETDRWIAHATDNINPVLRSLPAPGVHPQTPAGQAQAGVIYMGIGEPDKAQGNVGDFYFRTDTPAVASQRLYIKTTITAWTGIL